MHYMHELRHAMHAEDTSERLFCSTHDATVNCMNRNNLELSLTEELQWPARQLLNDS